MNAKSWIGIAIGLAALIVSAQLSFEIPGTGIPQTAQTVAVLVVGAMLGAAAANVCLVAYLLAGIAGLPVFSGGSSGASTLFGPTGGYLLGFWLAACLMGYLRDRGWLQANPVNPFLAALAGHTVIVALGGIMLSVSIGMSAAWFNGVQPFVIGALVKSVLVGVIIAVFFAIRRDAARSEASHVS
ncbi:MAG: biotin transporter BioY [Pseudomonadota bacterium]